MINRQFTFNSFKPITFAGNRKELTKSVEKDTEDSVTSQSSKTTISKNEETKFSGFNMIATVNKFELGKTFEKINEDMKYKNDLLAMGFTEDEINKYFKQVFLTPIGDSTPKNPQLQLKNNIEINGRIIGNIDDLKYELFQAPLDNLYNKVKAGIINQTDLTD